MCRFHSCVLFTNISRKVTKVFPFYCTESIEFLKARIYPTFYLVTVLLSILLRTRLFEKMNAFVQITFTQRANSISILERLPPFEPLQRLLT